MPPDLWYEARGGCGSGSKLISRQRDIQTPITIELYAVLHKKNVDFNTKISSHLYLTTPYCACTIMATKSEVMSFVTRYNK